MGGKNGDNRTRHDGSAKGYVSLQEKALSFSMSYAHGQELQMLEEKFETRHAHTPSLQDIFGNADGRRCAPTTVHNWDGHSRVPIFWREAGGRKCPQAAGKGIQT